MSEQNNPIYQLYISLRGIEPTVWRRIQVYGHTTFAQLHLTLQSALGWLNYHFFQFQVGDLTLSNEEMIGQLVIWDAESAGMLAEEARLMDHVGEANTAFTYEYDFGDRWMHDLVLEATLPFEAGARYPRCLGGARACPPEDVGGRPGYERFLAAIGDPADPDHDKYLAWAGGDFDPEAFSVAEVNGRFRKGYAREGRRVVPPLAATPDLTRQAAQQWDRVPEEARLQILQNTWCRPCRQPTTMIDYSGRVKKGRLFLEGHCIRCGGRVSRLLEGL